MESGGLLLAAHERMEPQRMLMLRCISDLADERKKDLDQGMKGALRRYAMRNALRLLWVILSGNAVPRRQRSRSLGSSSRPRR